MPACRRSLFPVATDPGLHCGHSVVQRRVLLGGGIPAGRLPPRHDSPHHGPHHLHLICMWLVDVAPDFWVCFYFVKAGNGKLTFTVTALTPSLLRSFIGASKQRNFKYKFHAVNQERSLLPCNTVIMTGFYMDVMNVEL